MQKTNPKPPSQTAVPSLSRISVENFFSIREPVVVDLENQGLVVVTGRNGQGKTSIFLEAISWLLYGSSFEYGAMPGALVRNRHVEAATLVSGVIKTATDTWKVERRRTKSNGTLALKRLLPNGAWEDAEQTTPSLTQEKLETIWGRDLQTFLNSGMFTSDVLRYPDLGDDQKKVIIDRLINATSVKGAYERVTGRLSDLTEKLQYANGAVAVHREMEDKLVTRIRVEQVKSEDFEEEHSGKREKAQKRREKIAALLSSIPLEIADAEKELAMATERLGVLAPKLDRVAAALADLKVEQGKVSTELRLKREEMSRQQKLEDAGKCPICSSDIQHMTTGLPFLKSVILVLTSRGEEMATVHDQLRERHDTLQSKVFKLQQSEKAANRTLSSLRDELTRLQGEDSKLIIEVDDATNPHIERVKSYKKQLAEERVNLALRKEEAEQLQLEIGNLNVLKEAYGSKGLRTLLLEDALPFLTDRIAEKMTAIGCPIQVSLEINAAGKLTVNVDNPAGAGRYHGSSAGERRLIDLALLFSFFEFYAEQSGGYPPQIIFDEAFEKVDEGWQEQLGILLRGYTDKGVSVFFISHSASRLEGMADQVWTVVNGVLHQN